MIPQPTSSFLFEEVSQNPILRTIMSWFEPSADTKKTAGPAAGSCAVAPLDAVTDPAALQLEAATGSDVVDVDGMLPAAAHALTLFQAKVASVGGTMILKSAYRPAAYQQHLQNVWYKWMELRNNHNPACQDLRAAVQQEFARHRLIEGQHPVSVSDHTRGLAFDATVDLPRNAKIGKRRLTLDSLARLAGFLRPAIATDPVHFKFLAALQPVTVHPHPRYVLGVRAAVRRRRNA